MNRVALLVDAPNFIATMHNPTVKYLIKLDEMLRMIEGQGSNREMSIKEMFFRYHRDPKTEGDKLHSYKTMAAKRFGFDIYETAAPEDGSNLGEDVDQMITERAQRIIDSKEAEVLVLASGDGDLEAILREAKRNGLRVEILTATAVAATNMLIIADHVYKLEDPTIRERLWYQDIIHNDDPTANGGELISDSSNLSEPTQMVLDRWQSVNITALPDGRLSILITRS